MLEMVGSIDSLEDCTQICTDVEESTVFPLKCWQNVCLSEIYIPSNLLPSRNKTSDFLKTNRSVFHTLQKKDSSKCIESFSVYSDSDIEDEDEIFESDSDSDLILNCETDCRETKTDIEQLSEDILSTASTSSPSLNEACDSVDDNAESYFHEEVINSSRSSPNVKRNCDNSSLLSEMCNYLEKGKEKHTLYNVENISNSQKLNISVSKSSDLYNAVTGKDSFDLSENINVGNVKNTGVNKLSDNMTTDELPLMQSILTFCDQLCDVKLQNFKDSDKNLCANKPENATVSQTSLHEILDTCSKFSIKELLPSLKNDSNLKKFEKKTASHLKRNNKKERQMKKKASKCIPLGEFLEDEPCEEDSYDDFFHHILLQQNKLSDDIPLKNNTEFPDLVSKAPEFIKSTKSDMKKDPEIGLKSLINIISESPETGVNDTVSNCDEKVPFTKDDDMSFGKIVIENIPLDVTEDDICTILLGYGEIKKFSLEHAGNFLTARVEMDLICDIDWIIECLNGSEPFGASSETLKCYEE